MTELHILTEFMRHAVEIDKYQQRFQPSTKWTKQEDEILTKLVDEHGGKKEWMQITEDLARLTNMPQRPVNQVNQRWHRVLSPNITRGKWSKDEDEMLLRALCENKPGKWAEIAKQVQGRTDIQIRYRLLKKYWWFAQYVGPEYLPSRKDDFLYK